MTGCEYGNTHLGASLPPKPTGLNLHPVSKGHGAAHGSHEKGDFLKHLLSEGCAVPPKLFCNTGSHSHYQPRSGSHPDFGVLVHM